MEGASTTELTPNRDERKGWREGFRQITVEPLVCLYVGAAASALLAVQNLQLEMACRVNLGLPSEDCDGLIAGNGSSQVEVETQRVVAQVLPWKTAVQSAIPAIVVLLVGTYSDRSRRRRPFLLLPIAGEVASALLLVACASNRDRWYVEWEAAAEVVLPAFTGSTSVLLMAVYAYVADVTSERVRTMRIGLVHIAATAAYPAAASVSGVLYAYAGYHGAFIAATILQFLALLYGWFRLSEPRPPLPLKEVSICDFRHVLDPFTLLVRRRDGTRRLRVALLMIVFLVIIGPAYGETAISYLYTRTKFNWDAVKFSLYLTYDVVIHLIGTTIAVTGLSRWLGLDDLLLATIACASKVAASFFYAFAETELLFYFAPAISILSGAGSIAMRSIATKLVEPNELGQIQSLFGICEAIAPVIYTTIYTKLYIHTIETLPGAFFLLGAALLAPSIVIFLVMYGLQLKDRQTANEKEALPEMYTYTGHQQF